MAKKEEDLTPRQVAFCQRYVIHHNGSLAAREAGYSEKNSDVESGRLLVHAGIRAYIRILEDEAAYSTKLTKENVLKHMSDIAFSSGKGMTRLMALKYLGDSFGAFEKETTSKDTGGDPNADEAGLSVAVEAVEKT